MTLTALTLGLIGIGILINMIRSMQAALDKAIKPEPPPKKPTIPRSKAMLCIDCDHIYEWSSSCPRCLSVSGLLIGGDNVRRKWHGDVPSV